MRKTFAGMLMGLVMVAVPLQGMAASSPRPCDLDHAAQGIGLAGHALSGHHVHAPVPESAVAGHHAAGPQRSGADATQAGQPTGHDGQASHDALKCCSVAGAAAAASAPELIARAQARQAAPSQPAANHYQGVVLDGPDRPPRLLQA